MTTRVQLRKAALDLPDTVEAKTDGAVAYTVGGTEFAACAADGVITLSLDEGDGARLIKEHPNATRLPEDPPHRVSIALADVNGQQLNHWVRRAWHAHAPAKVAEAMAAAETARAGNVRDLPKALGNPATRALVAAGVTSLAQVATYSPEELLALHGVGPRAIPALRDALAAADISWPKSTS